MAPVTHLARHRAIVRRDIPLEVPRGDYDLLPIAVFLWLCSAGRAALTLVHRQAFDVEATLALLCVLGLPLYVFRTLRARRSAR